MPNSFLLLLLLRILPIAFFCSISPLFLFSVCLLCQIVETNGKNMNFMCACFYRCLMDTEEDNDNDNNNNNNHRSHLHRGLLLEFSLIRFCWGWTLFFLLRFSLSLFSPFLFHFLVVLVVLAVVVVDVLQTVHKQEKLKRRYIKANFNGAFSCLDDYENILSASANYCYYSLEIIDKFN